MKHLKIFLFIFFLLAISQGMGQGFTGAWRVSVSAAAQEQDRRMFGWPSGPAERLITREEQSLTWQYSLGLHKAFLHREDFKLELGLRYDVEVNRFSRPVNHPYFFPPPQPGFIYDLKLRFVGSYQVHQFIVPLSVRVRLFKIGKQGCLFVGGDLLPALFFAKRVRVSETEWLPTYWAVKPYSLEVNPGIGYRWFGWEVMLSYRAFHRRAWDPALFGLRIFRPAFGPPTPVDRYNPHKLWLSLSYDLGADFSRWGLLRRE